MQREAERECVTFCLSRASQQEYHAPSKPHSKWGAHEAGGLDTPLKHGEEERERESESKRDHIAGERSMWQLFQLLPVPPGASSTEEPVEALHGGAGGTEVEEPSEQWASAGVTSAHVDRFGTVQSMIET